MPRPRSEEIPLELIKKAPNSVIDMSPKIVILPRPEVEASTSTVEVAAALTPAAVGVQHQQVSSEETSFIGDEAVQGSPTRKGAVETV